MRRWRGILIGAALVYGLLSAVLYVAMRQSPGTFGNIMSRAPGPAMVILPFKPLWNLARQGRLQVGDIAPDFRLQVLHQNNREQLARFRGQKPVVLVFGSYT